MIYHPLILVVATSRILLLICCCLHSFAVFLQSCIIVKRFLILFLNLFSSSVKEGAFKIPEGPSGQCFQLLVLLMCLALYIVLCLTYKSNGVRQSKVLRAETDREQLFFTPMILRDMFASSMVPPKYMSVEGNVNSIPPNITIV